MKQNVEIYCGPDGTWGLTRTDGATEMRKCFLHDGYTLHPEDGTISDADGRYRFVLANGAVRLQNTLTSEMGEALYVSDRRTLE